MRFSEEMHWSISRITWKWFRNSKPICFAIDTHKSIKNVMRWKIRFGFFVEMRPLFESISIAIACNLKAVNHERTSFAVCFGTCFPYLLRFVIYSILSFFGLIAFVRYTHVGIFFFSFCVACVWTDLRSKFCLSISNVWAYFVRHKETTMTMAVLRMGIGIGMDILKARL